MTESSTLDFELTDDLKAIQEVARNFAQNEIAPVALHYDETQEFPHEIFKKLGELGFLGILVPTEYGGSGMGYQEYAIIVEEIARACPAIALGVAAHNGLGIGHILRFGSEETKKKYLPMLASGETLAAWGLTEPGSGSDAGGMRTVGVRDGDDFIINGSKNFITHGNVGNVCVMMTVTSPEKGKKEFPLLWLIKQCRAFMARKKRINLECVVLILRA